MVLFYFDTSEYKLRTELQITLTVEYCSIPNCTVGIIYHVEIYTSPNLQKKYKEVLYLTELTILFNSQSKSLYFKKIFHKLN